MSRRRSRVSAVRLSDLRARAPDAEDFTPGPDRRLTPRQITRIRRLYSLGVLDAVDLAAKYGVDKSVIEVNVMGVVVSG